MIENVIMQSQSFSKIRTLRFRFHCINQETVDLMEVLINFCSGLEYFEFGGFLEGGIDKSMANYDWVRNLKGFAVYLTLKSSKIPINLRSKLTEKLESLHLKTLSEITQIPSEFTNLKELCFSSIHEFDLLENLIAETEFFHHLLQREMPNLIRLNIRDLEWLAITRESKMMQWLTKLMHSLEYLCVNLRDSELFHFMETVTLMVEESNIKDTAIKIRCENKTSMIWSPKKGKTIRETFL